MITWSNAWLTISYHAYQAEVFPTHIRARAVGFCYSFSRLSTAVVSILIMHMRARENSRRCVGAESGECIAGDLRVYDHPTPGRLARRRLLLLVQPALHRGDQHPDRHYSAIRRHAGVISFIVVSMLMVMLSVGIFGPRTRGIRLENI
jgi:hypothetical protein